MPDNCSSRQHPKSAPNAEQEKSQIEGKVYTLQEQIERAERSSQAVKAGHFYTFEELLEDLEDE